MAVGSATRGLVKQQHTWFRDDGDFKWVDASASTDDVVDAILREVDKPRHEGGCGDSGRLDAASARALREYRQPVKLLVEGGDATARALADAAAVCGGGGALVQKT
jgi:tRNA dimethylallyltransferase